MKPYGREKNLKGNGEWKVDYHMYDKHTRLRNWWEKMVGLLPRSTMRQNIKKDIDIEREKE